VGAPIALASTTNTDDYLLDVQADDVSFGDGVWMISWLEKRSQAVVFARIDANGNRLDPLGGRSLLYADGSTFLAPVPGGWLIVAQARPADGGLWSVRVGADGTSTSAGLRTIVPETVAAPIEAFTLAPLPMLAYTKIGSKAAYVDVLPAHPRAARH
jgi:hypothetical protein